MAAPMNSGESDMVTEDFRLNLSPLLSPRWSQLCLTPSPPRSFLSSSSSMVMQYQGSNQSIDDPPQNQEHDHIVDPAPYLAGDSALLQQQQQLRKNWSEASDWRPRGGGIMAMNNQGFEESNMGFEEESEEMSCFYFPPSSPTDFLLYPPVPSVFFVSPNIQDINLAFSYQHILEDKSGALHVINGEERKNDIIQLLFDESYFFSHVKNNLGDLHPIARAAGVVPDDMMSLVDDIMGTDNEDEMTLRRINWLEQKDEDNVDQPVFFEIAFVVQQLIQNRGGELDVILGGGVFTLNRLELIRDYQDPPTTPETLLICQTKFSFRVQLGHGGQWATEIRCRYNRLNIGSFTTVEDAMSAYELVRRWSGRADLTGFPGLFENENRSKLLLRLPPPAQELNLVEDFGLVCCNAMGNDEIEAVGTGSQETEECVMAYQTRLNSGCLGKRKSMEKNLGRERRNKKTNGVRTVIPLEDILQTKGMRRKDAANHLKVSITKLKSSCREYGIPRWPPRNERKLTRQSLLNGACHVVNQEGIPQLTSHSNKVLMATVDKNIVDEKEIPPPQLLPTTQQENTDAGFGNDEAEAIGIGVEGTRDDVIEKTQLNSGCSGKGEWKEKGPGGDRGHNKTAGVRISIPKEDILETKGMRLADAAKHLEVSRSTFKRACREYGFERWPPRTERELISQSHPNESPAVVDQEGIPHLTSDTLPSNQALTATVDKTKFFKKEILLPQLLPTAQQENPNVGFGNDEDESIGMEVAGTMEGVMVEAQLYSRCSGNGKWMEKSPAVERGKYRTTGVRIAIGKEDILQTKGMCLNDAAKHLEVSRSTFKRACRECGIKRWPPRKENKLVSQSCRKESPAVVDQEGIQPLNCDILPSDQALAATVDTNNVILKVRCINDIIVKFPLSWPWKMAELGQQVEKRLKLKSGTYYIKYKDEENDIVCILCDEDLQNYISSSTPLGTSSIEVFLVPK